MCVRVRETHFQHNFDFFVKNVPIDNFCYMAITKAFQWLLKSLSNSHVAKMVDWNIFLKKFKIMLKMCFSDPKAHPESILDI